MLLGYFGYVCTYNGLGIFLMVRMTGILRHSWKLLVLDTFGLE